MIREISLYSNSSKLTYIHPAEKLAFVFISLIVSSYTLNNYILAVNIILLISLNIIGNNPLKMIYKFIIITLFFSLFTSVTLLWQGYEVYYIMTLLLRALNGALTIAFLALSTPINHIVYLLSKREWARDVSDIIKSMERFIILIEDDFQITFKAIKSRAGFNGLKNSLNDIGRGCGLVFRTLIIRWKEINVSLESRCYKGRHNYYYNFKKSKVRIILLLCYLILMISLGYVIS